ANVLVDYRVRGAAARVVPFQEIWTAIEAGQIDVVQQLVDDRVVLILRERGRELRQTPIGPMSDMEIQGHALDTLASGQGLRGLPTRWIVPGALVVATLVAWLGLTRRWWMGPAAAVVLVAGYAATRPLALDRGLVLPLIVPGMAVLIAPGGALLWRQLVSAHRVRDLEHEIVRVRSELSTTSDALVRQESSVEALEEDLEAARQAVLRSTGAE